MACRSRCKWRFVPTSMAAVVVERAFKEGPRYECVFGADGRHRQLNPHTGEDSMSVFLAEMGF
jgi:hypothetical protein